MSKWKDLIDDDFMTYFNIADEIYGPNSLSIDELDANDVEVAREYATRVDAPWPPYLPWAEEALNDLSSGRRSPAAAIPSK